MTANARCIIALLGAMFAASSVYAQLSERDVRAHLDAVYAGNADRISHELPALLQRYPNDAGVAYIQAVLTTDGILAAKRYQEIADRYPQSTWADDALYKVYQYNFSLGLYKKADAVMEQLRSRYPQSIYVAGADAKGPVHVKDSTPTALLPGVPSTVRADASPASVPTASVPAIRQAADQGSFYVQVGVFSTDANARRAAEKFGSVVGRAAAVTPKTSNEKTQYLVLFEGFNSAESARSFSTELRTKYTIDSFVSSNPDPNAR
jgi:cell division septation protein DedD